LAVSPRAMSTSQPNTQAMKRQVRRMSTSAERIAPGQSHTRDSGTAHGLAGAHPQPAGRQRVRLRRLRRTGPPDAAGRGSQRSRPDRPRHPAPRLGEDSRPASKKLYARRAALVEPAFAQFLARFGHHLNQAHRQTSSHRPASTQGSPPACPHSGSRPDPAGKPDPGPPTTRRPLQPRSARQHRKSNTRPSPADSRVQAL
jgi:hypothetical protein